MEQSLHNNIINQPEDSLHTLFMQVIDNGNKILHIFLEQKNYIALSNMSVALNTIKDIITAESVRNRNTIPKDITTQQEDMYQKEWLNSLLYLEKKLNSFGQKPPKKRFKGGIAKKSPRKD